MWTCEGEGIYKGKRETLWAMKKTLEYQGFQVNGAYRVRTDDLLTASQTLSQLS